MDSATELFTQIADLTVANLWAVIAYAVLGLIMVVAGTVHGVGYVRTGRNIVLHGLMVLVMVTLFGTTGALIMVWVFVGAWTLAAVLMMVTAVLAYTSRRYY